MTYIATHYFSLENGGVCKWILHEFSHIFLIRNEYQDGNNFFDSCCKDSDDADVISGYSIWREYAAEVLACGLDPLYRCSSISKESKIIKAGLKNINSVGPVDEQRRIVTDMLTTVMTSASFYRAKDWDEFQQTCSRYLTLLNTALRTALDIYTIIISRE